MRDEDVFDATTGILLLSHLRECLLISRGLTCSLAQWVEFLIQKLSVDKILESSSLLAEEIENLEEFIAVIQKNPEKYTFRSFAEEGRPHDQVTISTRHNSKCLEFEVVIMLGMDEKKFPNYYSLQYPEILADSTRICFVCVSRAKRVCCLVRSKK